MRLAFHALSALLATFLAPSAFAEKCKPLNHQAVETALINIFDSLKVKQMGGVITAGVSRVVGSQQKGYTAFFAARWTDYAGNGGEATAHIECNDGLWQIAHIGTSARNINNLYYTIPR